MNPTQLQVTQALRAEFAGWGKEEIAEELASMLDSGHVNIADAYSELDDDDEVFAS